MARKLGMWCSTILNLGVFTSQEAQKFSKQFGRRLVKISINTNLIPELWVKLVERTLLLLINRPIRARLLQQLSGVPLNTRGKNVLLLPGHTFLPIFGVRSEIMCRKI